MSMLLMDFAAFAIQQRMRSQVLFWSCCKYLGIGSYQVMKRHGGSFSAKRQEKGANLKRLLTIRFQLYDIVQKARLWRQRKISGCQGLAGKGGWIGEAQRIFKAMKLLSMTSQWCHIRLFSIPLFKPKSELFGKLWTLGDSDVSM